MKLNINFFGRLIGIKISNVFKLTQTMTGILVSVKGL
jgi:hypothetical protein